MPSLLPDPSEALVAPFEGLLKSLEPGVRDVAFIAPGTPAPAPPGPHLLLPLGQHRGASVGSLLVGFDVAPLNAAAFTRRLQPALDMLTQLLANGVDAARAVDLRLLRLANELDLDVRDDTQLDKALVAVAQRTGVELAWLAAPRCQLSVAVRGHDHELDSGVRRELAGLRARVSALTGKLRRPLILNGTATSGENVAACQLLIVPLFVGHARHNAWMVLANPLAAPAFGGWHLLAARMFGQALARRLEVDLDRRTGLFNRVGLESALPRLKGRQGCLMLLDIDRLQSVNRVHGMAAGDAAIMALARLLAPPLLPPNAHVARMHGDQFAIVLPDLNAEGGIELAERLRSSVAAIQPGLPDDPTPMAFSAGLVDIDDFSKPFDRYALDADTALKLAKDRGRGRIEVYSAVNSTLIRRNDEVLAAADLRDALRTGALLLFAQPIRLLADRSAPPGFELLIRLRDESGEIKAPGDFVAAAQRFQLLPDLDRFVVDAALEALSPQRALLVRLSSTISINVSGQSVADESFVNDFITKLRASRVPPGLVILEVTEQAAVTNLDRAAKMMKRLREVGCGIAIDDFGTGANSLAYLRTLPVTRIKIDGSFVRDMLTNKRSESGVKGILQLAREFKLDTVAEFVESEALATRLAVLGVQRGQGYLFGKPEPIELALQKLADEESAGLQELLRNV
jgi:diguanylate cyclase (GGDEF)-like protein